MPIAFGGPGAVTAAGTGHRQARRYRRRQCASTRTLTSQSSCSCLDVASVLAEATGRAERVGRYGLSRTTPVRLHDLGRPAAVLSRPQRALACAIDGAASAQDLAWRCGLALHEAIENIGRLIAAGLCRSEEAEGAVPSADPLTPWFEPGPPPASLPRRAHPAPMLSGPDAVGPRCCRPRRSWRPRLARQAGLRSTSRSRPRRKTCCAGSWTGSGETPSPPA
ncbi:MAG TPA: hypothetical protein VMA97_05080 [Streptosporangiaceae bacterium]|nr:hypothetical protein [Streptosporangiaceae bacterium]